MRRLLILALLWASFDAGAANRSYKAKAEFRRLHPCPATAQTSGACPGWIVDHIEPLCAGGADHFSNMQWLSRDQARIKDPVDISRCARLRREQKAQARTQALSE